MHLSLRFLFITFFNLNILGGTLIFLLPERISAYLPTQEIQQESKETVINKEK